MRQTAASGVEGRIEPVLAVRWRCTNRATATVGDEPPGGLLADESLSR